MLRFFSVCCSAVFALAGCVPSEESDAVPTSRDGTKLRCISNCGGGSSGFPDPLKRAILVGTAARSYGVSVYGAKLVGTTAEVDGLNTATALVTTVSVATPAGQTIYSVFYGGYTATLTVNDSTKQEVVTDGRGNSGTYSLNASSTYTLTAGTGAAVANAANAFTLMSAVLTDVGEEYMDELIAGTTTTQMGAPLSGGANASGPTPDLITACYDAGDFCTAEAQACVTCAGSGFGSTWDTNGPELDPVSSRNKDPMCNTNAPQSCAGLGGTKTHAMATARENCANVCTNGSCLGCCSFVGASGTPSDDPQFSCSCVPGLGDIGCVCFIIGYPCY